MRERQLTHCFSIVIKIGFTILNISFILDDLFSLLTRDSWEYICNHIHYPQVDDLKAKLATQEIELQKKNEAADKLIRIVEAETSKVRNCDQHNYIYISQILLYGKLTKIGGKKV